MSENQLAVRQGSVVVPKSFEDVQNFSQFICKSELVPKDFRNRPQDTAVAIMMGMEVGLNPIQALQSIAVINGRPTIWGDAMLALVQNHPECKSVKEDFDEEAMTAICTVTRAGHEPHTVRFSQKDAETAGLWKKAGPWQQYPKRMLQVRARAWAFRDKFADALRGLGSAEEQRDIIDVTPVNDPPPSPAPETGDIAGPRSEGDSPQASPSPPPTVVPRGGRPSGEATRLRDLIQEAVSKEQVSAVYRENQERWDKLTEREKEWLEKTAVKREEQLEAQGEVA